ncbi:MAG: OmpA family protein [Thiotrichaceae bacterium]|nr:OmpA family protein [Thiotrichaceae bacterium]
MNKNVHIPLKLVGILTLFCIPALFAAQREYVVPMEKSEWLSHADASHECSLSQVIPFYGEGKFVHKSGHKVKFNLLSDEPVMEDDVKIILQSEPPAWRHDDSVFEIGKFDFQRGHNPLIIQSPYASRMLQQVENGMSPVVIYRDMADGRDIIAVMLSPINFRKALTEYRDCLKTLVDFDLDEIKNLKLYFTSNKDILSKRSKRDLSNISRYLKMDPAILQIKVDAHADSRGRRRFNDHLSEKRSQAVVRYLLSIGIKAEMIYAVNHGERKPHHTNKTALGRAKNRRADVQLLTSAPPTAEERKVIEAARKAERRRRLTERSIFNRPPAPEVKPETDKAQSQDNAEEDNQEPQTIENSPPSETDYADSVESDFIVHEPPAPNFINFDYLVDKNNQKVKSK